MAKYFLIAGEASGDLHAAALIAQLKQQDPKSQCAGLGGDRMEAAGCHLYQHIRHMAFMGFAAVLANLGNIRRNFRIAEQALLDERPDALILIDYPSFNLRMASFCRKQLPGTKIYYYIPPKVWAWKRRRVHAIARLCDEILGSVTRLRRSYLRCLGSLGILGYLNPSLSSPAHDLRRSVIV